MKQKTYKNEDLWPIKDWSKCKPTGKLYYVPFKYPDASIT